MLYTNPSTNAEARPGEGTSAGYERFELEGMSFEINWDDLDPPDGHPDAEELPHEEVVAWCSRAVRLPKEMLE
jgi:hypothetical protein